MAGKLEIGNWKLVVQTACVTGTWAVSSVQFPISGSSNGVG
jgi:hypothetical protein